MNRRSVLQSVPLLAVAGHLGFAQNASPQAVYELRQYTVNPGKLDELLARFRNHTIRIFDRLGIRSVAYWTVIDPAPDSPALIYILEHPSREAAERNWAAFHADPDWIKVKADSEVQGPLASKMQSTFMKRTDFSPLQAPPQL